ncbi:hypothetical protein [Vallitalea maricola]|uniref:Uncharacterized protein n=1 Tax=Vallitalea maricola TaxID=3074433 RepID=A0ACB5ULV8_9FIRM|nr:hypothetical protein AN2V17_31940 [Vallitalea sp. AN17-2]
MNKRFKMSVICILTVIVVILIAAYRDYNYNLSFNNNMNDIIEDYSSTAKGSIDDFNMFNAFDSNKSFFNFEVNYFQSLIYSVYIDVVLIGILCFWGIMYLLNRRKRDITFKDNKQENNLEFTLVWLNILNIVFLIVTLLFQHGFSYYSKTLYEFGCGNDFLIAIFSLLILIINIIVVATYRRKLNVFWYVNIIGLVYILIIKIGEVINQYDYIGNINIHLTELISILILSVLLYKSIIHIKNSFNKEEKKNMLTVSGFIFCGILLLMFLEVI